MFVLNSISLPRRLLFQLSSSAVNVKIIESNNQIRLGPALNLGLREIESKYVYRFDPDDIYLPNRVETQSNFLNQNPIIDILGSAIIEFSGENSPEYLHTFPIGTKNIIKELVRNNPLAHPSVVFKKEILEKLGGYVDLKNFEDYELWIRALKNGCVIENLNFPLVKYRINIIKSKKPNLSLIKSELQIYKNLNSFGFNPIVILFRLSLRIIYRFMPRQIRFLIRKVTYLKRL